MLAITNFEDINFSNLVSLCDTALNDFGNINLHGSIEDSSCFDWRIKYYNLYTYAKVFCDIQTNQPSKVIAFLGAYKKSGELVDEWQDSLDDDHSNPENVLFGYEGNTIKYTVTTVANRRDWVHFFQIQIWNNEVQKANFVWEYKDDLGFDFYKTIGRLEQVLIQQAMETWEKEGIMRVIEKLVQDYRLVDENKIRMWASPAEFTIPYEF